MRELRRIHLLAGCFVAPLTLLLAVTGAWQAFSYHKSLKDGSYTTTATISLLSRVHMNEFERKKGPPEDCSKFTDPAESKECGQRRAAARKAQQDARRPFGVLLVFAGSCLALNAITGVWMAFSLKGGRRSAILMIALGIVLPVGLLFVT